MESQDLFNAGRNLLRHQAAIPLPWYAYNCGICAWKCHRVHLYPVHAPKSPASSSHLSFFQVGSGKERTGWQTFAAFAHGNVTELISILFMLEGTPASSRHNSSSMKS
jgi:hypothetical protein